jgi:glyoxylase-like metal-dependent hydrolase (beta-lactamase superfamily II)
MERAVLLDSCAGGGKEFEAIVLSLTNKPISLVITHSDQDHTGGNEFFDTPAMHPAEFARYAEMGNQDTNISPLWEGDIINLGDTSLEVVLIPGHTPGSIALLDRDARRMFVGDTISDSHIYMFGNGRDLQAFTQSLRKLESLTPHIDAIHPAHGSQTLSPEWLTKTRIAAEKLLAGELEPQNPPFNLPCKLYSHAGVNLLYAG